MIHLDNISVQFGDRVLFVDVTMSLSPKHRYVIVGGNGAGKSSLLRVIGGEEEAALGEVTVQKSARIGWLKQDQHLYDKERIIDVVLRGRSELWKTLQKKETLLEVEEWDDATCQKLADLDEKIAQLDGYRAEAQAEEILVGLGFKIEKHEEPLKKFSGGWKMRVLLAQLLFDEPDILLLDEPTNYLDITSITWLEDFIKTRFTGLLLVVSHDQRFLENVGTCVLDIDYGEVRSYPGTYQNFLEKKVQIEEQKQKEHRLAEEKVARMQRFVDRFRGKPSKAGQVASRKKMIEKVEWPDVCHTSRRSPHFHFKVKRRSGQLVIRAKGVSKGFDGRTVLKPFDLEIERGERVAIIGPNGSGKTTLVRVLTSALDADTGTIKKGHEVQFDLFAQEHKYLFTGSETVLSWLEREIGGQTELTLRQTLGTLLFREEHILKKVTTLSGGEMARLLLARIMLQGSNTLVLDEPTNHLDLESIDALAEALLKYEGTLIIVCHDRKFVERVATRVLTVEEGLICEK